MTDYSTYTVRQLLDLAADQIRGHHVVGYDFVPLSDPVGFADELERRAGAPSADFEDGYMAACQSLAEAHGGSTMLRELLEGLAPPNRLRQLNRAGNVGQGVVAKTIDEIEQRGRSYQTGVGDD